MSALDNYKMKKKMDGNGPKTGADQDDANSTTQLLKRQDLEAPTDYFKKKKDKGAQITKSKGSGKGFLDEKG